MKEIGAVAYGLFRYLKEQTVPKIPFAVTMDTVDLWICNLNIHGIFNKSFWGFSDRFMSGLLRFHDYRSFFYELGEKTYRYIFKALVTDVS